MNEVISAKRLCPYCERDTIVAISILRDIDFLFKRFQVFS